VRRSMLAITLALIVVLPVRADVDAVRVDSENLVDSDGWNYGVNFFVTNLLNEQICVYPEITSQQNVTGSVVQGPVLLQPNDTHVAVGSFIAADSGQAWSVNIVAHPARC
jgi:hypothetical protein